MDYNIPELLGTGSEVLNSGGTGGSGSCGDSSDKSCLLSINSVAVHR